jgi:SAM-dependent methyltransferase
MQDPKSRFSDRAENYARYRPGYPREILSFLEGRDALGGDTVVADVGSGTGALSALFLKNGNAVLGVEPNREMRRAAERLLREHRLFESIDGSAEDTTLADESVDLVAVANALHWVDRVAARAELSRILRPDGRVAVVWHVARESGTPFLRDHADLMSAYMTGSGAGGAEGAYAMTRAFFGAGPGEQRGYEVATFPYAQGLNFEGFRGLVLSSSSVPALGQPGSEEMLREVEEVFRRHESGGEITMEYEVVVYCGRWR